MDIHSYRSDDGYAETVTTLLGRCETLLARARALTPEQSRD